MGSCVDIDVDMLQFDEVKKKYILGDDPRDPSQKKIFSAARFIKNGNEGYIYIILAGKLQLRIKVDTKTAY